MSGNEACGRYRPEHEQVPPIAPCPDCEEGDLCDDCREYTEVAET